MARHHRSATGSRCQLARQYFQSASVAFGVVLEDFPASAFSFGEVALHRRDHLARSQVDFAVSHPMSSARRSSSRSSGEESISMGQQ